MNDHRERPGQPEKETRTRPIVAVTASGRPLTPLLDRVRVPADLRNFSIEQ